MSLLHNTRLHVFVVHEHILAMFLDSCVLFEKCVDEPSGISQKRRKREAFDGIFGFSHASP
jgi:hypothetical protein